MRAAFSLVLGVVLGLVVGFLIGIPLLWNDVGQWFRPSVRPTPTVRVIQVDMERARLVHKSVYAEQNITVHILGQEEKLFGLLRGERWIIANGTCRAGIDHDEIKPQVSVEGTKVRIVMAEPKILDCGINSVEYIDGRSILRASTELSNRLHEDALNLIKKRASEGDLIAQAKENARLQTELYLRQLGFEDVAISFQAGL